MSTSISIFDFKELNDLADELIKESLCEESKTNIKSNSYFENENLSQKNVLENIDIKKINLLLDNNLLNQEQKNVIANYFISDENKFDEKIQLFLVSDNRYNKNQQIDRLNQVSRSNSLLQMKLERSNKIHSIERFQWLQIQDNEIDKNKEKEMIIFEQKNKSGNIHKDIEKFKTNNNKLYKIWIENQKKCTSSLKTENDHKNWEKANEFKSEISKKNSKQIEFIEIKKLNKFMENGKKSQDTLRGKIIQHHFMAWLERQLEKCKKKDRSVILTAARSYIYFVSIHGFRDGNGRTGRFLLNFILEKYGLPPIALLPEDVDGVAIINPTKRKDINKQLAFVETVFKQVKKSYNQIQAFL